MEQEKIQINTLDDKLTITVDEAAEMIGVGKNIMLNLVKTDGFPAVKFSRKIVINKRQFIQWFDDLTSGKINI